MHHALLVGGGETAGDLLGVGDRLPDGECPALEEIAERAAFEQLGDEVGGALAGVDVEEGEEVGVAEGASEASLLLEAVEPVEGVAQFAGEDLDRHVAAEAGVAGAVDLAHLAGSEKTGDLVRPQPCPGRERHGRLRWISRMMRPLAGRSMSRSDHPSAGGQAAG
ncbi:MAG TPA: hypothetical protein VL691_17755 [Vicinamibacteria bacterium]|nr:hypothetical protein [Vicinamibacteria bacterium]